MHPAELPEHIAEIVTAWCTQLRADAEACPRAGERGAAERALVSALVRVALAPEHDPAALHTLVIAAAEYGRLQNVARLDPGLLCDELALLREELWRRVSGAAGDDWRSAHLFILHVDRALGIVVRTAIRASVGHRAL